MKVDLLLPVILDHKALKVQRECAVWVKTFSNPYSREMLLDIRGASKKEYMMFILILFYINPQSSQNNKYKF